jgi:hypothetical protein
MPQDVVRRPLCGAATPARISGSFSFEEGGATGRIVACCWRLEVW